MYYMYCCIHRLASEAETGPEATGAGAETKIVVAGVEPKATAEVTDLEEVSTNMTVTMTGCCVVRNCSLNLRGEMMK